MERCHNFKISDARISLYFQGLSGHLIVAYMLCRHNRCVLRYHEPLALFLPQFGILTQHDNVISDPHATHRLTGSAITMFDPIHTIFLPLKFNDLRALVPHFVDAHDNWYKYFPQPPSPSSSSEEPDRMDNMLFGIDPGQLRVGIDDGPLDASIPIPRPNLIDCLFNLFLLLPLDIIGK